MAPRTRSTRPCPTRRASTRRPAEPGPAGRRGAAATSRRGPDRGPGRPTRPATATGPGPPAAIGRGAGTDRPSRGPPRPATRSARRRVCPMPARGSTTAVRPAATTAASSSTPAARGVGSVPRREASRESRSPASVAPAPAASAITTEGGSRSTEPARRSSATATDVAASGAARRGTRTRNGYARSTAVAFVRGHGGGAAVQRCGTSDVASPLPTIGNDGRPKWLLAGHSGETTTCVTVRRTARCRHRPPRAETTRGGIIGG